jgi:hypothetical protein
VFVFHTEKVPNEAPKYFGQCEEKGRSSGVLALAGEDNIEKPGGSHYWVYYHCHVIYLL